MSHWEAIPKAIGNDFVNSLIKAMQVNENRNYFEVFLH